MIIFLFALWGLLGLNRKSIIPPLGVRGLLFFVFVIISATFFQVKAQQLTARIIFDKMLQSIDNTKTCSYNLKLTERVKDGLRECEYVIRLNANPYKVYAYIVKPHPGARALYISGENANKAYIYPNRFPYINISLSPQNKLLSRNHLFTMNQLGFEYIGNIMKGYFNRDSIAFMKWMKVGNDTELAGRNYYTFILENNLYALINYTVKQNEDIYSIAKKLLLNDNSILLLNPRLSGFDDVTAGDVIKVPNTFAKKIILLIDKRTFLPAIQEMHDEKGFLAKIEMTSIRQNPTFDADEFTRTKKEYGF